MNSQDETLLEELSRQDKVRAVSLVANATEYPACLIGAGSGRLLLCLGPCGCPTGCPGELLLFRVDDHRSQLERWPVTPRQQCTLPVAATAAGFELDVAFPDAVLKQVARDRATTPPAAASDPTWEALANNDGVFDWFRAVQGPSTHCRNK